MLKESILNEVLKILDLNGFRTITNIGSFDILARKKETLLLKILLNIDSLSRDQANDLKILSSFLSARTFIISQKTNRCYLSDNTLYYRFGIPVVTLWLFERIISERNPDSFSSRGKHLVEIDRNLLRSERTSRGLSLGDLGKKIKMSKKSLYEIEMGRVRPTAETVEKLEKFFDVKLSVGCQIKIDNNYEEMRPISPLQKKVYSKLSQLRIRVGCLKKSPFEIIAERRRVIFAGLSESKEDLEKKSRILSKVSSFTKSTSLIITRESEVENFGGIPVVLDTEIDEIESYRQLSEMIRSRN